MRRPLCQLLVLAALILGTAAPVASAMPPSPTGPSAAMNEPCEGNRSTVPVVFADGWGRWFSGAGGRTRVVQFCVITMCIALFIMMRKFQ